MSERKKTYGFGVDPIESQNHFFVVIPPKNSCEPVRIYERFEWTLVDIADNAPKVGDDSEIVYNFGQVIRKSDILRMEISRHKWSLVAKDLAVEFNTRLKEQKKAVGKFAIGGTGVERLFGKEMMVLLWGIEDCDPSNIPTAIRNWKGLIPEERWWLYTTTNASTGGLRDRKGWRTALRYALCENPVEEKPQISMFENWDVEDMPK